MNFWKFLGEMVVKKIGPFRLGELPEYKSSGVQLQNKSHVLLVTGAGKNFPRKKMAEKAQKLLGTRLCSRSPGMSVRMEIAGQKYHTGTKSKRT